MKATKYKIYSYTHDAFEVKDVVQISVTENEVRFYKKDEGAPMETVLVMNPQVFIRAEKVQ